MRKEVVFSDLNALVNEKDRVSTRYGKDKWTPKAYATGAYSGQMLVTMETGYPEAVSFDLNLKGNYKIFLCLPRLRAYNYLYVKLSDDLCYTGMAASDRNPINWSAEEFFEEIYWKTADLTGQKLIISKSDPASMSVSSLAWIRCVPADELQPAPENKCMQMHIDGDIPFETPFVNGDEYVMKLFQFKDSNVDFVSFEISFDYDTVPDPKQEHLLRCDDRWDAGNYIFSANKEIVYKKNIAFAKKHNIKLYAANRMAVSNFVTPFTRFGWNVNFVEDNPRFYYRTRTGTTVNACSYAYPEVQDYVVKQLSDAVKLGFDGVSLLFHRGMFVGFEAPVLERFRQLYPHIDPHRLPFADPRLHGVWCEFMNQFMHKLRNTLGKDTKINAVTGYGLQNSKNIGLDVEYWVKNGLVDSVSQADMEIYENLADCMSDDNPAYIDLEKYQKDLEEKTVVCRAFGTNLEKVLTHMPEYLALKQYGVEVYHVLPWIHKYLPEEYPAYIRRLQEAGAEKFLSWNTNHLLPDVPEWHAVRRIGNEPERETLRTYHRVLSIDGYDISQYHPNWRG